MLLCVVDVCINVVHCSMWDLENFSTVSVSDMGASPIRCTTFHPNEDVLFTGCQDQMRTVGWEPYQCHDVIQVSGGIIFCPLGFLLHSLVLGVIRVTKADIGNGIDKRILQIYLRVLIIFFDDERKPPPSLVRI